MSGEREPPGRGVHPRVVAATRAQLRAREAALRRGAAHVGWKVALDFAEIQAVVGSRPVAGHLTSETVIASGASFSLAGLRAPRVETELVIEVGASGDDVAGLAVGLEIVDVARPPDDLEGIIAANVAHRACVLGESRPLGASACGTARILVNGELRQSAPVPDVCAARLAAIADLLGAVGLRLRPGDRVLAGSLTHVAAGPGDRVVAEIDALGRVEATLGA